MELRKIDVNFEQLQEEARRLEEIAAEIKRLADQQMTQALQDMAVCWKGETASAYFRKASQVKQDISATAKLLNETAEGIREQAKRIYNAEMQAVMLTKQS